ncbi:MAG: GIY-YIG nuclease family protein [Candidatus Marinimicrobia bacterium]|nr:GIY-YIG nuclease family protein [Candidatus Neomarinimicrobiota bacterium]
MSRTYCIYMMTNRTNTVLYTGLTNDLARRVHEHKTRVKPRSFTARYNLNKLVYVEAFKYINDALAREKQIKKGSRRRKEELINEVNPEWNDLSKDIAWW